MIMCVLLKFLFCSLTGKKLLWEKKKLVITSIFSQGFQKPSENSELRAKGERKGVCVIICYIICSIYIFKSSLFQGKNTNTVVQSQVNSLQLNNKVLEWFKLKAFADNKSIVTQILTTLTVLERLKTPW